MSVMRSKRLSMSLGAALSLGLLCASATARADEPAASPSAPSAPPPPGFAPPKLAAPALKTQRRVPYWTWDANVEGGLGAYFLDGARFSGFGRVRGGVLRVDEQSISEPRFLALGMTYEISNLSPAAFGVELETLGLASGLWAQLGAFVDIQPRPGAKLGLGWSMFGVEGQLRWDRNDGVIWAAYAKLRVPVGILGWAWSKR
jgi:hypothetical protein